MFCVLIFPKARVYTIPQKKKVAREIFHSVPLESVI